MKIALCIGNLAARGKYGSDAYLKGYAHIKEALLNNYSMDVFLHSYEPSLSSQLLSFYNPQKFHFENQVDFYEEYRGLNPLYCSYGNSTTMSYQNLFSMSYSRYVVGNLVKQHEEENGFKYDWVIFVRYDISSASHIEKIYFNSNFDNNYIYIPMFEQMNIGPQDQWFYSKSDNARIIFSLYTKLKEYLANDSMYVTTAINGWISSNENDYKSNDILNPILNVKKEKMKISVLTNAHAIYKWHYYVNNIWSLDKLKFIAVADNYIFKEEPHLSIIRKN